jgi:hypothetical protein
LKSGSPVRHTSDDETEEPQDQFQSCFQETLSQQAPSNIAAADPSTTKTDEVEKYLNLEAMPTTGDPLCQLVLLAEKRAKLSDSCETRSPASLNACVISLFRAPIFRIWKYL